MLLRLLYSSEITYLIHFEELRQKCCTRADFLQYNWLSPARVKINKNYLVGIKMLEESSIAFV